MKNQSFELVHNCSKPIFHVFLELCPMHKDASNSIWPSASLFGSTRLGWDKFPDRGTWPFPTHNRGQTYVRWWSCPDIESVTLMYGFVTSTANKLENTTQTCCMLYIHNDLWSFQFSWNGLKLSYQIQKWNTYQCNLRLFYTMPIIYLKYRNTTEIVFKQKAITWFNLSLSLSLLVSSVCDRKRPLWECRYIIHQI